jgi:hypothetical protein
LAHINAARYDYTYFHNSLNKHGESNFDWDIIDFAYNKDELDFLEVKWIKYYNSFGENGYNLTTGGSDNFNINKDIVKKNVNKRKKNTNVNNLNKNKGNAPNKHKNNLWWSKNDIAEVYKYENPNWTEEECKEKATIIARALNTLNGATYRNNKKFFEHNTPFSFSPLLEEEQFNEFRKTYEYQEDFKDFINNKAIKMVIKDLDKEEDLDKELSDE